MTTMRFEALVKERKTEDARVHAQHLRMAAEALAAAAAAWARSSEATWVDAAEESAKVARAAEQEALRLIGG